MLLGFVLFFWNLEIINPSNDLLEYHGVKYFTKSGDKVLSRDVPTLRKQFGKDHIIEKSQDALTVLKTSDLMDIFRSYHKDNSHKGRSKMHINVGKKYKMKNLRSFIEVACNNCITCQKISKMSLSKSNVKPMRV